MRIYIFRDNKRLELRDPTIYLEEGMAFYIGSEKYIIDKLILRCNESGEGLDATQEVYLK